MSFIVKRLRPNSDLKQSLAMLAHENQLQAGVLISVVGSLTFASLRMAGGTEVKELTGPLEIVSGTGTISDTSMHIHLSVSSKDGSVYGGHLMEGCPVYTTVELVVQPITGWNFKRTMDAKTGYEELDPQPL